MARSSLQNQWRILSNFIIGMWVVELFDLFLLGGRLDYFGIHPRQLFGLVGIPLCPFLHGGLGHLMANTFSFLALGWLVMWRRTGDFAIVTSYGILIGGLGIWIFGKTGSVHVGASGVIFSYLGFLLFRGYYERRFSSILFSLFIGFLYSGMLWGILPGRPGVSWEGHLFGFIGGVMAAKKLAKGKRS